VEEAGQNFSSNWSTGIGERSAKRKRNECYARRRIPAEPKAEAEPVAFAENLRRKFPPPVGKDTRRVADDTPTVDAQAVVHQSHTLPSRTRRGNQKFIAQSLTGRGPVRELWVDAEGDRAVGSHFAARPMHTPTLEKLLDFVLGAVMTAGQRNWPAQLEHIHAGRGDLRSSERFGELRRRFQRVRMSDEEVAAAVGSRDAATGGRPAVEKVEAAPVMRGRRAASAMPAKIESRASERQEL